MSNPLQGNGASTGDWFEQILEAIRQEGVDALLTKEEDGELQRVGFVADRQKHNEHIAARDRLKRRLRRIIARVARDHARAQPESEMLQDVRAAVYVQGAQLANICKHLDPDGKHGLLRIPVPFDWRGAKAD
jgi:hypothetical protein